jgi:hypothetical protein
VYWLVKNYRDLVGQYNDCVAQESILPVFICNSVTVAATIMAKYSDRVEHGLNVHDDDKCKIACKGDVYRHFSINRDNLAKQLHLKFVSQNQTLAHILKG